MSLAEAKMHPITLRFPDDLEREFLKDYSINSLKQVRFAGFLAILLWCGSAVIDYYLDPPNYKTLWFIRFVVTTPILLIIYACTWLSNASKFMSVIPVTISILIGISIVFMSVIMNPPGNYLYH